MRRGSTLVVQPGGQPTGGGQLSLGYLLEVAGRVRVGAPHLLHGPIDAQHLRVIAGEVAGPLLECGGGVLGLPHRLL